MKKLSEIYKELGVEFSLPIRIKNAKGNITYYENSDGYWRRRQYNSNGKETCFEDSDGYLWRSEHEIIELNGKRYQLID